MSYGRFLAELAVLCLLVFALGVAVGFVLS